MGTFLHEAKETPATAARTPPRHQDILHPRKSGTPMQFFLGKWALPSSRNLASHRVAF